MPTFEQMMGSREGQDRMREEIVLSDVDVLSREMVRSAVRASEITEKLMAGGLDQQEEDRLRAELTEEIRLGCEAGEKRSKLFGKHGVSLGRE